jgi:Mrp family chromosome partitioning ATPase
MRDLRPDLANLWRSSARLTSPSGARAVMFLAARSGEGTTSMAASFALIAAERAARTAWLVDLDLRRNDAYRGFEADFAKDVGVPGRAFDASLNEAPIYTISPNVVTDGAQTKLMSAHQISRTRLLVTRFRHEQLRAGQKVQIHTQAPWWNALRRATDWIIVDAPALDRSSVALAAVNQMDAVVLVVGSDKTTAEEAQAVRLEVEAHGGSVLGVVMNRMGGDARLADRFKA